MSCTAESDEYWSYNNPSQWCENFPAAIGTLQSPIDIKILETIPRHFAPFELSPDYSRQVEFTLKNNGHQVAATLAESTSAENQADLWLSDGGLPGKFHFVNFHLHWGRKDRHGSEHEVNGKTFSAEAHIVHKNNETGKIAVFAFFLTVTENIEEENREWKKYSDIACQLVKIGDSKNCTFNLNDMMNIHSNRFFRYMGSLTTPPCTEGIIWTIFLDPISIIEDDLILLRENIMRKAYRPVQPINDRIIYRNDETKIPSDILSPIHLCTLIME